MDTVRSISESRINELTMKVDTSITLDSVLLSDENKDKIQEFLKETKCRDKLLKFKLKPMNRLLFYGASGCGKTTLARALSNHLGYTMLYVDIAKSLSQGNVSQNLSDIYAYGNEKGNCIIFLDECDSIAWSRDSKNAEGGDVRRATNSLFQQMDQMNPTNIAISATNMLKRLDPAFERRFNMKLEFRRPNSNLIEDVQHFLFSDFKLEDDMDEQDKRIVEGRMKLSYYEIQDITERAMKKAVMNDSLVVKTSVIYKDIAKTMHMKIRFGTDKDNPDSFPD